MQLRTPLFASLTVLMIACSTARGPATGGPCEYDSYEGTCTLDGVQDSPNTNAPELSWVRVRFLADSPGSRGVAFEDSYSLPTREVESAQRHYRTFNHVACKGARIRHGTCSPQEGGFSLPRFRFPGSPSPQSCRDRTACERGCERGAQEDCARAGYTSYFALDGARDLPRAQKYYEAALKPIVETCRAGHGASCAEAATYFELGLVPSPQSEEHRTTLLKAACKLGETWACSR